jgi:hypothetical protein
VPDEVKNHRNSAAQDNRGGEHVSQQRNAPEKYNHRTGGENHSTNVSVNRYFRGVNLCVGKLVGPKLVPVIA